MEELLLIQKFETDIKSGYSIGKNIMRLTYQGSGFQTNTMCHYIPSLFHFSFLHY